MSIYKGLSRTKITVGAERLQLWGARYSYSEFKSIWGYDIKLIESLTIASYLKVLFEEYRWNEKELEKIELIPYYGKKK